MIISRSTHVAADGIISLFFMAEQDSIVYLYHIFFFFHQSVDGHLGYFRVWSIVNSGAMNIGVRASFWIIVLFRYMPRNGIAGSYGCSLFSFLRNFHPVLRGDCSNVHSHWECRRVPFSSPSPAFVICRLFNDDHSDWCDVVPQYSFDLHISNN